MNAEKQIRHVLYCPHCGNTTVQTFLLNQPYMEKYYGLTDGSLSVMHATYSVVKCETCSEVLVYSYTDEAPEDSQDTPYGRLMYPRFPGEMKGVPDTVRQIYEETARVQNISPIAFVVLARRLLEEICLDKNAQKRNLADSLKELVLRGELPPVLADASDLIRFIGNAGAHASKTKITVPQTWAVRDFIKVIIEYLYVAPHKISDFKSRLGAWNNSAD